MSTTYGPSGGNGRGEARRGAPDSGEELKRQASQTVEQAKQRGSEKLEQGKEAAATQAEQAAAAVRRAADELGADSSLASYANQLSEGLQTIADGLRNKSVSDIAADMETLARRNPTTFVLASVAVGLALGRFMKASPPRSASTETSRVEETIAFEEVDTDRRA